ncbi:MAG: glycoside hydrolase family 16 protein [Jannaschia sp.]
MTVSAGSVLFVAAAMTCCITPLVLRADVGAPPPDLSDTIPIIEERFEGGLNRYDGRTGLWSTDSVRGSLMTNAARTVFLDRGQLPDDADALLPPILETTAEGLSIRTIALPPEILGTVGDRMRATGQGQFADDVRYATGRITTAHTWAQQYGWFEIEARIPRGKGRWPAFWLTFAGPGWPPEIDIFEAYGEGIAARTPKDGRFNTAVHFDALDADRRAVHAVDIVNPFDDDPKTRVPRVRQRGGQDVYNFSKDQRDNDLGADIYAAVHTFAALWTPEEIVYYFGPDRLSLREIYRVPTPDDARDPMFLIANDQFTARGGAWPEDADLDAVLDPANDFLIRSITVRALRPDLTLDMNAGAPAFDPRASVIRDTAGDDIIAPGAGFDVVELSSGADEIRVSRGREGKMIEGFGPDDRLVLEGFSFDSADAHTRLTQVGSDVWLSSGADPFWPQSVILRDTQVGRIAPSQIDSRWPVEPNIWNTFATLSSQPATDEDGDGRLEAPDVGGLLSDGGKTVRLIGGPGPERYLASNPQTRIEEPIDGGIDTLVAWGRRSLPANVERGILQGQGGRLVGGDGDDRLEATGQNLTLAGGAGDDLYVIAPEARAVTVTIDPAQGHDRLRGWSVGHRLVIASALIRTATFETVAEGTLVSFSPDQSLLIEGLSASDAQSLLTPN